MENQKENHKYLETNGDYRMRELDKSDLEQFNALLQYAFQVTSYELLQTCLLYTSHAKVRDNHFDRSSLNQP